MLLGNIGIWKCAEAFDIVFAIYMKLGVIVDT